MRGHQEYLEAPYTDAARREAEFEAWCEENGINPESDGSWDKFDELVAQQQPDEDDLPPADWGEVYGR